MKTLKDLDYLPDEDGWKAEIRQAAIEWVKEIRFRPTGFGYWLTDQYQKEHVENEKRADKISINDLTIFIKHFFNLTEEDLK